MEEELVRNLNEHARAVAGIRLASTGATVEQVLKRGDRVTDKLVRPLALEVDDEPHSAAIVLVLRAIQASSLIRAAVIHAGTSCRPFPVRENATNPLTGFSPIRALVKSFPMPGAGRVSG